MHEAEWTVVDADDNAASTASKTGVAGRLHVITHITASYSAAAIKLLTVKSGTTTILQRVVHNAADLSFPNGLRALQLGDLVSADIAASGTGGVLGYVGIAGYTL